MASESSETSFRILNLPELMNFGCLISRHGPPRYIRTGNRFSYLSLITYAFSRKIIGWSLQPTLHARGPLMALDMALSQKEDDSPTPLIHHSDRGIQYCCHQYIHLLENNEIIISMTESPDPYENALAERTNLTLKHEFLLESGFPSFHQAYYATEKAIYYYNYFRPHASLDYLTPAKAHELNIPLKKRWKKYSRSTNKERFNVLVA